MRFATRREAGRGLAAQLAELALADPVVLALPRGGVPVAVEVASRLGAPLDLVIARKIGAPGQPELAAAAVVDGERPELVRNPDVIRNLQIGEDYLAREERRELAEIARRRALYLGGRARVSVAGRSAIVVDDGIATGATVRAALRAVRRAGPATLVLAVPVADASVLARLREEADRIVCLHAPNGLAAVGQYYRDFRQVEDAEVVALLDAARPP